MTCENKFKIFLKKHLTQTNNLYYTYNALNCKFGPVVKRLRHRPFTAVSWVRIPSGSPNYQNTNTLGIFYRLFVIMSEIFGLFLF